MVDNTTSAKAIATIATMDVAVAISADEDSVVEAAAKAVRVVGSKAADSAVNAMSPVHHSLR